MPQWLRRLLENRTRAWIAAFGLLMTAGVLDYVTGSKLEFSFFYLLPLSIAGWYVGKRTAIAVALLGAAAYPLTDAIAVGPYRELGMGLWNFTVRGATLTTIALVLTRFRQALERERDLARKDPLTGIANARWFTEIGTWECARARRSDHPLSLAYLDLDGFKAVNDSLGHSEGDRVLLDVATVLKTNTRAADLVARLGGDEFALLMPETDELEAMTLVDRLTRTFRELENGENNVSFSIGLATFYGPPEKIDDALRVADRLMYEAKGAGRDRTQQGIVRDVSDPANARADRDSLLTTI